MPAQGTAELLGTILVLSFREDYKGSNGPVGIRTRGLPRARRTIYQTDLRARPLQVGYKN